MNITHIGLASRNNGSVFPGFVTIGRNASGPCIGLDAVISHHSQERGFSRVICCDQTTLADRQILGRMKTKADRAATRTDRPRGRGGAKGVGSVLDYTFP